MQSSYPLTCLYFTDCKIDGKHFLQLSRQDIAVLFPKSEQFIFGMTLFRYIEEINKPSTSSHNVSQASDIPTGSKRTSSKNTVPASSSRKAPQDSDRSIRSSHPMASKQLLKKELDPFPLFHPALLCQPMSQT